MANKRIVDLTAAGAVASTDLFEIDTGVASFKATAAQIFSALGKGMIIQFFNVISSSPAGSTTYYFGFDGLSGIQTVYANASILIPKAGTLKAAYAKMRITTPGTAEAVPLSIRINDTTDIAIASPAWNANTVEASNLALNQAIAASDTFVLKVATPAWGTPPLTVRISGYIYVE